MFEFYSYKIILHIEKLRISIHIGHANLSHSEKFKKKGTYTFFFNRKNDKKCSSLDKKKYASNSKK